MLRRMKIAGATVHGSRSSFRDWAGNVSNFPREIAETALAHVIGDHRTRIGRLSWRPLSFQTKRLLSAIGTAVNKFAFGTKRTFRRG